MTERVDNEMVPDLIAFADGELDAAASADVLEFLSTHPQEARDLARMMRFQAAVARNLESATPAASDALRSRVSGLLAQNQGAYRRVLPAWRRQSQVLFGFAAAALLLLSIGLGSGWLLFSPSTELAGGVPAITVQRIDQTHVECSRAPSLHNLPFPHEMAELEGELKACLGNGKTYPDLQAVGYEYVGAGACTGFLPGMVHLLYKSAHGPLSDTVSLFVREYHGEVHLVDGKVYWVQAKDAAHPTLVWRKGGLVFFLVGDAPRPVEQAAEMMHLDVPA